MLDHVQSCARDQPRAQGLWADVAQRGGEVRFAHSHRAGPSLPPLRRYESNYFASVLLLGQRTAPVYGITHIVKHQDRDGSHALPLFGAKNFIEWLPRLGELVQIG